MLNQQIISPEITPLQFDQTVEQALKKMEDLGVSELPVIRDGHFEGLIAEDDLLDANTTRPLTEFQHDLQPFAVNAEDHFLMAARLMMSRNLSIVPVVSADKEYVGAISQKSMLNRLTYLTGLMDSGALIVVDMDPQQFSISELSKLVETNDAHIRHLNTSIDEITGNLVVTLRINKQEVSDIVATLQRYDYHVAYYSGEEHYENELRKNYNNLMNFLTM